MGERAEKANALDATAPSDMAVFLSSAGRAAIYPGPGNPEYARGPVATMRALERAGVVEHVSAYSVAGLRGGRLTERGKAIRAALAKEALP